MPRIWGLDWKETYLALLDDLKVKNLKIAAHWDLIEPQDGVYDFADLDWQLEQARLHNAKVMLAIGMKTPRWPECHVPEWAKNIGKEAATGKDIGDAGSAGVALSRQFRGGFLAGGKRTAVSIRRLSVDRREIF